MAWLTATLTVGASLVDVLANALLESGAVSVDVADADAGTPRERAQWGEPGEQRLPTWERSTIKAMFERHRDVEACVAAACSVAGLAAGTRFALDEVPDLDWVRQSRDQFLPVRASPRLWVVPSWHSPPDAGAINLRIDPGLAFGTGTHPTTRLCLEWLDHSLCGGERVLDYGCGSGILAIAALKLGAASAIGIDIDQAALDAARDNARQNAVAATFMGAQPVLANAFDVVLANILANPLVLLAPLLAKATREGGNIALSGILDHQAQEVAASYAQWFTMQTARCEDGWVLLTGVRARGTR